MQLRIAIVTDLHAYDTASGPAAPSHLSIHLKENDKTQHPVTALLDLIQREPIRADLLISAGDMADKAQEQGIRYAWTAIHRIKAALHATEVGAVPGNHDLDSRHLQSESDPDPKGMLQDLSPPFPTDDEALNDRFWSQNFVLLERDNFRLLMLNSSAFHGGVSSEIDHGRISSRTLARIDKCLSQSPNRLVNILLVHHHPIQHEEMGLGATDVMRQGQLLMALLSRGDFGEWLVIHGHKHHPKLSYGLGGSATPTVFSAGSLCASLYLQLQTQARNQFYVMTINSDDIQRYGLVGRIEAWDWASGLGWQKAGPASGLPAKCGFGYRTNIPVFARTVAARVHSGLQRDKFAPWSWALTEFPPLDFLIPADLDFLIRVLRQERVDVVRDDGGVPKQIGIVPGGAN
ncbi:MAG TPA: metallophosphoesterase [Thermoanaerobaculia bacterium]|jgi:3',5'-cyclic AMP phosphodiesterase CpdA|nr:metallophosphoesterase [Thermoanaerobaculia bacterium]